MTFARVGLSLAMVLGAATRVAAQPPPVPVGELTVSAGIAAGREYAIGDRLAELRRSTAGETLPLFRAESAIGRALGVDLRVGYALTPWVTVEATGSMSRPQLMVSVTGDTEALTPVDITEDVSEYTVGGSALVYLPYRLGSRGRPYVIGGAEYLRQLHEDRLLVETGQLAFAGGGVRYWLRRAARGRRSMGLRGEIRLIFRSGGIDFEDRSRRFPRASAFGFIGF